MARHDVVTHLPASGPQLSRRAGVIAFAAVTALYVLVTATLASRKLLWNDELYTYYIARLPTMQDVWAALMAGGEQTPPFFYLVTRLSFDLFGTGEAVVRLPEIAGFWVMTACLYVFVARRAAWYYALCAAAFPLVTHAYYFAFEARPYGLVLGFAALGLVSWQSATLEGRRRLAPVALALSLSAAAVTHYYGILVVLPLALGEVVRTLHRRRVDSTIWAALALPLVPLAWHLPLLRAGAAYSSAFWAPPQWVNIPGFYDDLLAPAVVPVMAIMLLAVLDRVVRRADPLDRETVRAFSPRLHEVAAGYGFIALPFVCVILAKAVTGAFVYRYALPAVIGFAVLAGFGAAAAFRRRPVMGVTAMVCLTGWFVLAQAREFIEPTGSSMPVSRASVERPAAWVKDVRDQTLPLVIADPHSFTVVSHYGAPAVRSRVIYLADPDRALKYLGHNSVERGMLDLIGPWFGMNVVRFESFIGGHSRFLIYGDFVRLAFMNWIVPELRARGMRIELLNREGDNMLLLAVGDGSEAASASNSPAPLARTP